jgi:hypothetical protein
VTLSTDEWVAQATAALLEDAPPVVAFVPVTWQAAHHAEYRRRLLAVYAACAGWPRAQVAPLWPFVEAAERAFAVEEGAAWGLALAELEKRVGVERGSD